MKHSRDAFTLLEVMIAVMIISVVIMALLQMFSNNTHIFTTLKQKTLVNQYASFLVSHDNYGLENKSINMYRLVDDFDIETDLRRELKNIKVKVMYQELETMKMDKNMAFEVGKSILKTQADSAGLIRFQLQ